ncbi:MAG TPA: hypothetical protein VGZ33_04850 [Acidimicrobiales bacterium]|jgi:uncharacterized protein YbjT (DUF2867 family)|nr:hypothetical protein [Acidimicrobiales bacterium]
MRIAVLGGSGVVGRHAVGVALARGLDAVALSRSTGVDVVTGAGLDAALEGVTAAIDVTNVATIRRGPSRRFFESGARSVQQAAARAGVAHVVVLSIVGVDRLRSLGYYDAKCTQERHHLDGPVPATIVRATQFHEFPGQVVARSTVGPVALVPAMRVQTVAARSVAEVLVDAAAGQPTNARAPDVAGPGPPAELPVLVAATLARRGARTRVIGVPLLGAPRRASRDGSLLPAPDARLVGPTFEAWLDELEVS